MTRQGAPIAADGALSGDALDAAAARDWQAVRADADIQYAPLPPVKPPETPGWLQALGEWLRDLLEPIGRALGMSWPVLEKVLIALAVLAVLFLLWKLVEPLLQRRRRLVAEPAEWSPDKAAAIALLEDADRLAAEGRYGEAAHLLLQRSVHHISEARPDWLLPASTAREIAALPMLPAAARSAFGSIAGLVERSLFALRELDAADWRTARAAYADFALQRLDRAA